MKVRLAPWQEAAIHNPFDHFAFFGGVASGKTATGSHFSIEMLDMYPGLTGFIGANTYDQLSQATLRELFYWLEQYNIEYVSDQRPPKEWGNGKKRLKTYKNVISVLVRGQITHIFTRVLSDPDALRGLEFSWYWIDETRDTEQYAHDMILARLRESDVARGLITTTTNGEDWVMQRFVKSQDMTYGSMHVRTIEAVKVGLITEKYYETLRKSYSPLMASQELDAEHVNTRGGRAYYAANNDNRLRVSPWGETAPNPDRPLIVGCDFNFQPAPLVWVVGQLGPSTYDAEGNPFWERVHWYREFGETQISTREMTRRLIAQYPGFTFRVFGDMSGNVGTTSNAGETDFAQMSDEFAQAGVVAQIHALQLREGDLKRNPLVKDRVENTNRMLRDGTGFVSMTYNPDECPLLDGDMKMVGWKQASGQRGRGKLDDAGDHTRTHASDAVGYALHQLFPPGVRGTLVPGIESATRAERGLLRDSF